MTPRQAKSASERDGEDYVQSAGSPDCDPVGDAARSEDRQALRRRLGPICPQCGGMLDERAYAQVCLRPGCNTVLGYAGSGRNRINVPPGDYKCLECGEHTPDLYFEGAPEGQDGPFWLARCAKCERARNLRQALAVAANPNVLEDLRDRMRRYAEELERAA